MVAYDLDFNAILVSPFKTCKGKHFLEDYNYIVSRLRKNGMLANLQILDNDASAEYKRTITEEWGNNYQLVPPDINKHNAAERAIRTFKAHFSSILMGIAPDFVKNIWYHLLPQNGMTSLRQSTLDPTKSAWGFFMLPLIMPPPLLGLLAAAS